MIGHWFTPHEKNTIQPGRISKSSLWHQIHFIQDEDYQFNAGDLLLISLDRQSSQRIKKNLYQFSATSSSSQRIVDCGILNQKNPDSFLPVIEEILQYGAMVVFLGAPISFMRFQVDGKKMASIIRESNLDDDIHLRNESSSPVFQYIGTQRHLISEIHNAIEGHLRLSELKEDISLAEPCIRDSEALIFHCDSLSASESGYLTGMSSSGLTIIEACQLFRYAGASQSLSSVGIYGYNPEEDPAGMLANSLAQMIWYLLEGSTLREDPERSTLTKYVVQTKNNEQTLLFYKSEISGRWWIENNAGCKISCSYNDYRKACEEDYSPVIIKSILG